MEDGFINLVNRVPYSNCTSFDTIAEAMNQFRFYHPHCRTAEDITHMNKNCPLKASNLNNPSKQFRLQVRESRAAAVRGTAKMLNATQLDACIQSL